MKKILLFFIAACLTSYVYSQTLFTYGNNAVSKDEFIRAYNKNKTAVTDKAMALREYLELYIKFKLKVKAAKDTRIDTLTSLATDLQNFRTQIEESYLNDESQVNALTQEAFNRSQEDIHVAYLFFPLKEFSDSISVERADKSLKANWKDIGFITVFNLPYQFENIVFGLKPGEESHPYRAKSGYYIFKNVAERKALGKIKAAQILIAVPEDAKEEDKIKAGRIADSVYRALLNGADFSEAAKNVSNDKMTYMAGGLMPEFGVGKYDPQFEHTVFALQKDSDITAPFQTKFGYHIVKRLSITEIPQDKSNDSYLYTLKQQVLQDNRITSSKEKFKNDVLKKLNYKKNVTIKENDLWKLADSFAVANKKITIPNLNANTILFSLNNQNIKVSDWLTFIKDYRASASNKGESSKELLAKYVSKTAVDNYKKRLPDLNPEFKYQLQEFKDGNILFEVMERNVWNKASNDSIGLKNYYNQHKTKYTWGESADAILISCSNEKTANSIAEEFKKGKSMRQIAEENVSQVQTDSGRYDLAQIPAKANTKFVEGMITEPLINKADGTATFVKILRIYPANQQRSFEEARGLVTNEYQNFLEEKWIEQLKKKYPVKVNEKIFQSLL
ncbi:MAG: peptidylprolyl isomerase [Chitinophagaceae bacterium]